MIEKNNFIKHLGLTIRKARKAKNMSIEELAFKCNIGYSSLANLELGKAGNLQTYNLYKLIEVLGIDANIIFNLESNSQSDFKQEIKNYKDKDLENLKDELNKSRILINKLINILNKNY